VLKGGAEQRFGDLFARAVAHAAADLTAQHHGIAAGTAAGASAAVELALARRAARLAQCLGVEEDWVISKLSAGQRARVQLALQLLRPKRVLLMDEVTAELDVEARAKLLAFLKADSEGPLQLTVVYATHVFDGLDKWATHLLHLTKPTEVKLAAAAVEPGEAEAAAPAVPSGRLLAVADALDAREGTAAGSTGAVATTATTTTTMKKRTKKRTIYSTVLKWLVEENKAARKDAEGSSARASNGDGEGEGATEAAATAAAALSFPTTAAARRAKQDASLCARSTTVARDKGPLPVGWGFRANALPG
jgi:ATPase subunit of ABC transporter with duplicated ATPase domains